MRPGGARRLRAGALRSWWAPLRQHERLLMISISTVLVTAGQGVIAPLLPLFAREFNISAGVVGLTLSLFALSRLVLNVPLGIFSDRHGRRMLLVWGPVVTAVGMVGSGLAQDIEQLLAARAIAGAGSAMYMIASLTYLADISTDQNRARFIATNQGALLLGVSIGPAVGGVLAELYGFRVPFYVVGVAALVAGVYAYWRLPETRVRSSDAPPLVPATATARTGPAEPRRVPVASSASSASTRRSWLAMLASWSFVAVAFVTTMIFFTRAGGRQTIVPLLADSRLNMSTGMLGAVFTGMSLVNLVLIGPAAIAADRFGRRAVIVPSGIATVVGLLIFAGATNLAIFLLGALVLSVASAMAGSAPAAYVADIAPAQARGLAMSFYRSAGDVGFVVGPPLLGVIADRSSFAWALSVNAALVAAATLLFLLLARETMRPRQPARAPAGG
ncbi:MAG: MFS transporter [Chloroflexi bacterium]|nr:MFS transporter [Chloroflexota bacterium]